MPTQGTLFSLLDYLHLKYHNAACLSHDFKFLTASDFHRTWYKCYATGGKSNSITISYGQR